MTKTYFLNKLGALFTIFKEVPVTARNVIIKMEDVKKHLTGKRRQADGEISLISGCISDPVFTRVEVRDLFESLGTLPVSDFLGLIFSDDFHEPCRPEGQPHFADIVRIGNESFAVISWELSPSDSNTNHPGSEMTAVIPINLDLEVQKIMTAWYQTAKKAAKIFRTPLI